MKHFIFKSILWISSGIILLFIIAPIINIYLKTNYSAFTYFFKDNELQNSIYTTLLIGMLTTLFFSILTIPFTYFLARTTFKGKQLILSIIDIPIVIPHTAAGIALLTITANGKILGYSIVDTPFGIGLAMAFVSLPFFIQSVYVGFCKVPVELEKVSYSLGKSPFQTFLKISVPLAWREIVNGFIMMFARGISEFGAIIVIAYYPKTTSVLLYDRFLSGGIHTVIYISAILITISIILFVFMRLIINKK